MTDDTWAPLAHDFVTASASLKGVVRHHVIHGHLLAHLPPPPAAVVDVGGGAGAQSIPLARLGYDVTIVDPSAAMLDQARATLRSEAADVRSRVTLVQSPGETAPGALDRRTFAAVLCHGVVMYADDPAPLLTALADLTPPGGVLSLVALNAATMAVRPALDGRWRDALEAFDATTEVGVLGLDTRADTLDDLTARLAGHGLRREAWYGVWLFTDGWTSVTTDEVDEVDDLDALLAVELEASRRDPYRSLSRLLHLVGRRTKHS